MVYDYEDDNTFLGNNEFRHFDIKSIRYHSDRIEKIISDSSEFNIYLSPDFKKTFNNYSIEPDLNGQFYIRSFLYSSFLLYSFLASFHLYLLHA
mgnify:CR=1 FL=1